LGDVSLPANYTAKHAHIAAPFNDSIFRSYGDLVNGSGAALFLDMWVEAIEELTAKGTLDKVDDAILALPGLNVPQHSQTSLSTRDAWLKYNSLPNRRPFQFMTTLPALSEISGILNEPKASRIGVAPMNADEQRAALKTTLYMAFSKPFKIDLDALYRRDNHELIKPMIEDQNYSLTTVAERIQKYFLHGEAKSQGAVGLLTHKYVVGISKGYIGKESHPLADVEDLPDDATLETYRAGSVIISKHSASGKSGKSDASYNHALIERLGVERVAEAIRVDPEELADALAKGRTLKHEIRGRIAQAISSNAEGNVDVNPVPITPQETIENRVGALLMKHGRLTELADYIFDQKMPEQTGDRREGVEQFRKLLMIDVNAAARGNIIQREIPAGLTRKDIQAAVERWNMSRKKIKPKLAEFIYQEHGGKIPLETIKEAVSYNGLQQTKNSGVKRTEIEAFAKKFYGVEVAQARKAEHEQAKRDLFAKHAEGAGTRVEKSRKNKHELELQRIAKQYGMSLVPQARSPKVLARKLEPFIGAKIVRLVSGFGTSNQGPSVDRARRTLRIVEETPPPGADKEEHEPDSLNKIG
jgi:hypothetical protein